MCEIFDKRCHAIIAIANEQTSFRQTLEQTLGEDHFALLLSADFSCDGVVNAEFDKEGEEDFGEAGFPATGLGFFEAGEI